MMTPQKITRTFITSRGAGTHTQAEQEWIKAVYGCILKVARANRQFTVDAIWAEMDSLTAKGKMPRSKGIDHRILGPMIRHMVSEGLLGSSGYYTKSERSGGGSRPVTIWDSFMYKSMKVAA